MGRHSTSRSRSESHHSRDNHPPQRRHDLHYDDRRQTESRDHHSPLHCCRDSRHIRDIQFHHIIMVAAIKGTTIQFQDDIIQIVHLMRIKYCVVTELTYC